MVWIYINGAIVYRITMQMIKFLKNETGIEITEKTKEKTSSPTNIQMSVQTQLLYMVKAKDEGKLYIYSTMACMCNRTVPTGC